VRAALVQNPTISPLNRYVYLSDVARYLGYRRVDQTVIAGPLPDTYEAIRGQFDSAAAATARADCATCLPAEERFFAGVPYLAWGEDFEVSERRRLQPPVFDNLGRGGRFVITEQAVMRTLWTEGIEQMISASLGDGTLAGSPLFRTLAETMEAHRAHSAMFTDRTQQADRIRAYWDEQGRGSTAPMIDEPELSGAPDAPVLEPYLAVAGGCALADEEGFDSVIVLVHADAGTARRNEGLLARRLREQGSIVRPRPWRDLMTSFDLATEGAVLTAVLRGTTLGKSFLEVEDPLLLHR
jgi:hypothetical protein